MVNLTPPTFCLKALWFRISSLAAIGLSVFALVTTKSILDFILTIIIGGFCWHVADSYTAANILRNTVLVLAKKGRDDNEHPTIGPEASA